MSLFSVNPFWQELRKDVTLLGIGAIVGAGSVYVYTKERYIPRLHTQIHIEAKEMYAEKYGEEKQILYQNLKKIVPEDKHILLLEKLLD